MARPGLPARGSRPGVPARPRRSRGALGPGPRRTGPASRRLLGAVVPPEPSPPPFPPRLPAAELQLPSSRGGRAERSLIGQFPPLTARWETLPGSGGGGCHGDRGLAPAAMSFKRDESDPGPLGALQRRRVAELLASAIPEDEALLLRDGRLACSLCPHRPVCDTLETLLLHRAGRKHLDSLHRCYSRPRCPQVSPQGPQVTPQEAPGVALALQAPLLARTRRIARSALLSSAPYNSRCRKQPTKSSSSRVGTIPKNSQRAPEPLGNPGNPENPENPQAEGVAKGRKAGRKGNSRNSEGPKGNSRNSEGPKGNSRNSENPERLRILRHHLHLRSRGWLQDPAGNWIKDDNVEFDSDEEEPPPLPPA